MQFLRAVVLTVLLGLLLALTQAPTQAADYISAPAPQATPAPMWGEVFSLHGELGVQTDPARNKVYLQWSDNGTWRTVKEQASTDADGTYNFTWRIGRTTSFRVTAHTAGGPDVLSAVRHVGVTPQWVTASIERVCNAAHDCADRATAIGQVSPARENRRVVLYLWSGSNWKPTSVFAYTDEHGKFETPSFNIATWPGWSTKQLRIGAWSYQQSSSVVSPTISFMPGPKNLGDNVLRVDVARGAFPAKKGVDYTGHATLIKNGIREINRARLDKFGVRGSTTAGYPKKPYNLRFQLPPTVPTVFGMPTDRSWTLLAMYADQSYVRDKTALDLGRKLAGMTWNPDSEYVELFVNSQYMGAYLMTEKVQIDGDKVNVGKNTGMIMETDMATVEDPRKGFMTSRGRLVFAFKDPDNYGGSEGITTQKLSAIKTKLGTVESYLYSSSRGLYYKLIDPRSAADFHLAQEFFKDTDADFWRSKYFSWDMANGACGNVLCDGRLYFGPLWDFDKSIGNVDATNPGTAFIRSYRGWAANGTGVPKSNHVTYYTHWFVQLWKVASWRSYLKARWNDPTVRDHFVRTFNHEVNTNKALLGHGAANDRRRWAGSAKLYRPKGSTYQDEVNYVRYWLANRFKWIDSQL